MSPATAEKSSRIAAFSLAVFFLFAGVFFSFASFVIPMDTAFVPPFETASAKRAVFLAVALAAAIMGVGFLLRRVWAVYAFVAYTLLGTAWHLAVGLTDPASRWLLCSPLVNLPIAYAVYKATRPALISAVKQDCRHSAESDLES